MFIVTAIQNAPKLRRSETKAAYILRSYGAVSVSKRVSINISSLRDLCVQETCSENKNFDLCYTDKLAADKRKNRVRGQAFDCAILQVSQLKANNGLTRYWFN